MEKKFRMNEQEMYEACEKAQSVIEDLLKSLKIRKDEIDDDELCNYNIQRAIDYAERALQSVEEAAIKIEYGYDGRA